MAENTAAEMKPTLGLTGLTMNAMALIAPGAFLWLTFAIQGGTGATSPAMWIGIVVALLLCLATAVCYAEMAKLYPGTGSSYYFAEQSFLNHEAAWPYARLAKFIVGWGSHLYYWIYPGVMVGVMGVLCGYLAGTLWPTFMSASNPGPAFMMVIAVVFSFAVAWIANRGVTGSTAVNIAINVIQIAALLVFSVMALGYRMNHPPGSQAFQFDSTSGDAYTYEFATEKTMVAGVSTDTVVRDKDGVPKPKLDAAGKPVPFQIAYPEKDEKGGFLSHPDGASSGIRIGNVDGRGGQERQAGYSEGGDHIAAGSGGVLLPDRVLLRELFPQQRVHHAKRVGVGRAHR
jgi:APA family basic amino acid/polyamine antiporter